MSIKIYLTLQDDTRCEATVVAGARGDYILESIQGFTPLKYFRLSFDILASDDTIVTNHDTKSDSLSCFGASEHIEVPEMTYKWDTFYAKDVESLQKGLDRLKARVIDTDEY